MEHYIEVQNILSDHFLKTKIIQIPSSVIEFLQSDTIILSSDDKSFPDYKHDESDDDKWDEDESEEKMIKEVPPEVGLLKNQIMNVIDEFGPVFPKLNLQSPKDASWMNPNGSLKCLNADQVLLLLRSSDEIAEKIELEKTLGNNFYLFLKKWYGDISESSEFRCFVKNSELVGISQRYCERYYPYLKKSSSDILTICVEFFEKNMKGKLPINDYIFDVYKSPKKVWLVDVSPLTENVDLCLYTWEEIETFDGLFTIPTIKVVEAELGVLPNNSISSRLPFDLKDLSNEGALKEFIDKMEKKTN